ncbi:MAG: PEGA domain-containing protein [Candidatus Saccharimonadales bacterium]
MDFLDPQKQKAHARRLIAGYILIGMVLLLATVILLYQAFGYGIDRHGRVFQNGLVFISSLPDNAEVYVNGERQSSTTNTRLVLPAGQYVFELKREGYRAWKRAITVEGSTLQRFDYPLLFADNPETALVKQYAAPGLATQSLDKRWLLVQSDTANSFELFDINADNPVPSTLAIPTEVLSNGETNGWQEVEWSKDNRRLVLKRLFTQDGKQTSEYILVDRENANASVNLSVRLGFTPTVLQLRDKAHDQYYAFDQPNGLLFTATLERPTPQPYLDKVLAFQSDGADSVLYATSQDASPGKTLVRVRQGDDHYTIRQVEAAAAPYMLDIARYDGDWYVAAGASAEDRVYVYKNPVDALKSDSGDVLVPVHILKAARPTYAVFSPGSRFILAEGGQDFSVFDVKNNNGYSFQLDDQLSSDPGHATWADEYHLTFVTADGQIIIVDYDGTNRQVLAAARAGTTPFFTDNYRRLYALTATNSLDRTELRAPRDR